MAALRSTVVTLPDFQFDDGGLLPQLQLHVTTLGEPSGEPVLVLHGTGGSGTALRDDPAFGGLLFGPGQPLDAARYFVILPDAIGHGGSSKPSDGLRLRFPRYTYDDMVRALHRLLTEYLGVRHLRLLLGNSMGGMLAWLFAQRYAGFADITVPMASMPVAMAGRNWMLRRLIIDTIRNDPEWAQGQYTRQPASARVASVFFGLATNGGSQALYRQASTRRQADELLDQRLAVPFVADANDILYQWESSRDYDASAHLERIQGTLLAINSADDERNPPELGVMEQALARVRNGRLMLIPGTAQTAGHGTTGQARFWKDEVEQLLRAAPRLPG